MWSGCTYCICKFVRKPCLRGPAAASTIEQAHFSCNMSSDCRSVISKATIAIRECLLWELPFQAEAKQLDASRRERTKGVELRILRVHNHRGATVLCHAICAPSLWEGVFLKILTRRSLPALSELKGDGCLRSPRSRHQSWPGCLPLDLT